MRSRVFAVASVSATALIAAAVFAPVAGASSSGSGSSKISPLASMSHSKAGKVVTKQTAIDKKKGKCKTKFAPPVAGTPDGLIAWNNNAAPFDTAGAVDFTCAKATTIKKVQVYGYSGGQSTGLYNVSFYKDSGADALNEPLDASAVCSYTDVAGAIGGAYPTSVLTTLNLAATSAGACKVGKGTYWVSVQDHDASGPWYWEVSATQQGYPGDWIDRGGAFVSTCHTFDGNPAGSATDGGDTYLSSSTNCLTGYNAYLDYRFKLS